MTQSSSSAAEKKSIMELLSRFFILFMIFFILFLFLFLNRKESNSYILKTLELSGFVNKGDIRFKINCFGCHGITARELVGPDLRSITKHLNDTEIIRQVIEGLTPPMPSFEIDPQNMSNSLIYSHNLE